MHVAADERMDELLRAESDIYLGSSGSANVESSGRRRHGFGAQLISGMLTALSYIRKGVTDWPTLQEWLGAQTADRPAGTNYWTASLKLPVHLACAAAASKYKPGQNAVDLKLPCNKAAFIAGCQDARSRLYLHRTQAARTGRSALRNTSYTATPEKVGRITKFDDVASLAYATEIEQFQQNVTTMIG